MIPMALRHCSVIKLTYLGLHSVGLGGRVDEDTTGNKNQVGRRRKEKDKRRRRK